MYSINVFLTFSLSNLGMSRLWIQRRHKDKDWKKHLSVHLLGLILCAGILVGSRSSEKFTEGGWITLVVTMVAIMLCWWVRAHYRMVAERVKKLSNEMAGTLQDLPNKPGAPTEIDPEEPTAVVMAGGYGPLGLSTLLQIDRVFPGQFKQVVFISAGVIDSGSFKGADEIEHLRQTVAKQLEQYVTFARDKLGWAADWDMVVGTEAVSELERLCREVHLRFPRSVFFAGKLIFREPSWWHRLLHNETAHAVQRRLEFEPPADPVVLGRAGISRRPRGSGRQRRATRPAAFEHRSPHPIIAPMQVTTPPPTAMMMSPVSSRSLCPAPSRVISSRNPTTAPPPPSRRAGR